MITKLVSVIFFLHPVYLDVIAAYKDIIYRTSNATTGSTAHMIQKSGPFGRSCQFTNHMAMAGNYNNNGLNTISDRERFVDRSKDFMGQNS